MSYLEHFISCIHKRSSRFLVRRSIFDICIFVLLTLGWDWYFWTLFFDIAGKDRRAFVQIENAKYICTNGRAAQRIGCIQSPTLYSWSFSNLPQPRLQLEFFCVTIRAIFNRAICTFFNISECVRSIINFHPRNQDVAMFDMLEMIFLAFNVLNMKRTDGWIQNVFFIKET